MAYGQRVKCNNCESTFLESAIVLVGDIENDPKEQCPVCKKQGCLMDLEGGA